MDWNQIIAKLVPAGMDPVTYLIALGLLFGVTLALGLIGRYLFGQHSTLHDSVSSVMGILCIYALVIVIHSTGLQLGFVVSPLPFISFRENTLAFYNWFSTDFTTACGQLLNMVILAFVANLIDRWMPRGKNLFVWLIFRCLSIALGVVLYSMAMGLLNQYLPEGLLTWAPVILLCLLVLALMVGALKFLVGALLLTVNPIIALLYTFFFATVVGKMVSKAMLTTGILAGIILLLNYFGIQSIYIGVEGLIAYIPLLLILALLWYIVGGLLNGSAAKKDK